MAGVTTMGVEIIPEDDRWAEIDLQSLADRAAGAVLTRFGLDADLCEISLLACDDAKIAGLNADFRAKAAPTNVLSWPASDLSPPQPGAAPPAPQPDPDGNYALGDIAMSFDTCAREAGAAHKPLADHATHLLIHGMLHLLGFDHIEDADADRMEGLEIQILAGLGLENPYIVATGVPGPGFG